MTIKPLTLSQVPQITTLHMETLHGDFLPLLGGNFLATLYSGVIGKEDIYGFFAEEKQEVTGFIMGTKNMDLFFKTAIKSNFLKLILYLSLRLFKKPQLLKNVFKTFLYPKKDHGAKAELIIIAISQNWQGEGIGKKLVHTLESKFIKEKIKKYKLTVHANKKAVGFYNKLGFTKMGKFNLYDKLWYIYEKELN